MENFQDTALEHLPHLIRHDLRAICTIIADYGEDVAMIFLHGEFADGNPLDAEHRSLADLFEPQTHFEFIVATGKQNIADDIALWREVRQRCRQHQAFAKTHLEVYSVAQLQQLNECQAPISSRRLCLLYSPYRWHHHAERLTQAQHDYSRAQGIYEHGYPTAEAFLEHFHHAQKLNRPDIAAWQLKQCLSTAFKTLLRLHEGGSPAHNHLSALKERAEAHVQDIRPLFNGTPQSTRAFQRLDHGHEHIHHRPIAEPLSRPELTLLARDAEQLLFLLDRAYRDWIGADTAQQTRQRSRR